MKARPKNSIRLLLATAGLLLVQASFGGCLMYSEGIEVGLRVQPSPGLQAPAQQPMVRVRVWTAGLRVCRMCRLCPKDQYKPPSQGRWRSREKAKKIDA